VLPKSWLAFTYCFFTKKIPMYYLISMEISNIMKQIRFHHQTIQYTTTLSQTMKHEGSIITEFRSLNDTDSAYNQGTAGVGVVQRA
jgi:hypothetical protein